jgi:hypothetical protein
MRCGQRTLEPDHRSAMAGHSCASGARRGERRYNRRATGDLAVRLLVGKETASPINFASVS